MIRYRCEAGSSKSAKQRFHHINRLGRIVSIQGYRFRSLRGKKGNKWIASHERVLVKGVNGTARFDGVCWSYFGEGPRLLVDLLLYCGINKSDAETVAFTADRKDEPGIDWKIDLKIDANIQMEKASYLQ